MSKELQYQIAATLFKGVGPIGIKSIIAKLGGLTALFEEKPNSLRKLNLPASLCNSDSRKRALELAEKEIRFIEDQHIIPLFYLDKDYPRRLKNCDDCPILLYKKGNTNLNPDKSLAIVGTRNATEYGKSETKKLISELKDTGVNIISGLAYGIDITAHRAAIKNDLATMAVLGHDLGQIYPKGHTETAEQLVENGALISEFSSSDAFHPGNFPSRNRIIAGMSDAVLVMESKVKGGAIITADIANSYNRDVFALPGNTGQKQSKGCNFLIKKQRAQLIESAEDIKKIMSWDQQKEDNQNIQRSFFIDLDETQTMIVNIIKDKAKISIDDLTIQSEMNMSKLTANLLDLELKGIIQTLPGKCYKLV